MDWNRLERLLDEASALAPELRSDFLARACEDDAELFAEVSSLVGHLERSEDLFSQLAADVSAASEAESSGRGERIGHYKLLEVLGEGGMGRVWLAEQQEPVKRRVALKIIKLGMDTREVVSRFESERQALALLDHPNIAKVHDGGTTPAGTPYFVMELVEGIPITEYCDAHRLHTRDRLRLVIDVCQAVQHAHQKGLIHRDLKPSNLLVTVKDDRPVVKVIDFGVAKAVGSMLTDSTLVTRVGQVIGTPEYMSPEQAERSAADIDTRADIYSLGVVLYELLTGTRPFELAGLPFVSISAVLRHKEAPRPSVLFSTLGTQITVAELRGMSPGEMRRELSGDLDWIVLKALEKDRTDRYPTAEAMAADIGRYLRSEPVLASPPSVRYTVRKFVRRNRGPVTAAAALAFTLTAGVIGTSAALLRAVRAEAQAERDARTAQEVSDFLVGLFESNQPGGDPEAVTARTLLDRGEARIQRELADQPDTRARFTQVIARAYSALGIVQPRIRMAEQVVEIRESLGQGFPELTAALLELITAYGRDIQRERAVETAIRLQEHLRAEGIDDPVYASVATLHRGIYLWSDPDEAIRLMEEGLDGLRPFVDDTLPRRALGESSAAYYADFALNNVAIFHARTGNDDLAEALFRERLENLERPGKEDTGDLSSAINNLGVMLRRKGDLNGADSLYRHALALQEARLGPEHVGLANGLTNLSSIAVVRGDTAMAISYAERVLRLYEEANPGQNRGPLPFLARLYAGQGRFAEADSLARAFLANQEPLGERASARALLAQILSQAGRQAEAEAEYRQALAGLRTVFDDMRVEMSTPNPPSWLGVQWNRVTTELSGTLESLAELLRAQGRAAEADVLAREAEQVGKVRVELQPSG